MSLLLFLALRRRWLLVSLPLEILKGYDDG
jgi:hypothetical protein